MAKSNSKSAVLKKMLGSSHSFCYIILVTTIIDGVNNVYSGTLQYVGFLNEKGQTISQFLTGDEIPKTKSLKGLVQLPKLFVSQLKAAEYISKRKHKDSGFGVNHEYIVVPIPIS